MHDELQKLLFKAKEVCPEASDEVIKDAIIEYLLKGGPNEVDKYHGMIASGLAESKKHLEDDNPFEAYKTMYNIKDVYIMAGNSPMTPEQRNRHGKIAGKYNKMKGQVGSSFTAKKPQGTK